VGGNEFPFAPDVTALVGFDWKVWSRDQQSISLSSTANYMGHYFYDPSNGSDDIGATLKNGSQPYWLIDARLTYVNGRYAISAYGRNLGDKFYLPFNSNAEGLGFDYSTRGMPRTFGLEGHVTF
jgi:iron complex outermembrane receptor protein